MYFIKLNEKCKFKNNNKNEKNIAILTKKYFEDNNEYDDVFIFQLFEKLNINDIHLDNWENSFLDSLNFFIIEEKNFDLFKTSNSNLQFDLIILNNTVMDSNLFDLNLFNSIIEISKFSGSKLIVDMADRLDLIDLFYDDSNLYLSKTLIQKVNLVITSDDNLQSKIIDFNDHIIVMPQLFNSKSKLQDLNIFKRWIVLLKALFNNSLMLDVITEYLTEIAEYDIIHTSNEKNKYRISVVIPIHNTGIKLKRTLTSIEHQTFGIHNIEILMVNDCSTDDVTINILNEFVQKQSFKLIDLKENQGRPGIPRNIGIKEASADYIMFLDHDDFFEISALEKLYDEILYKENNSLDLVFGAYATVIDEKSTIDFDENDKNGYVKNLTESPRLLLYPAPSVWTKLFKKDVIINNNIFFPHILGEDAIFVDKFLLNADGIKYLQKTLIAFHDLGKQSITNNVTLRYLRESVASEQYLEKYFEIKNKSEYFKYRMDVLANFHLKKYINQSDLTEKEIRLVFPKYKWAMEQIQKYGSDLLYDKYVYDRILANDVEQIIKIKLPYFDKQNILYITILDESNSFPLIDSLDKLLVNVNIYALTYTDFKIKLWSCNYSNFTLLKEIKFNDRLPNFYQLNKFYNEIFDKLKIDKMFFRHFGSNQKMFFYRAMIQSQRITPITFASDKNIPTLFGKNSKILLENLDFNYLKTYNVNPNEEKGVVYTAIFGDYEPLLNPKFLNENLDYICFTDNPNLKSDIWKVILIDDVIGNYTFVDNSNNKISFEDLDYTRKARTIKILPHIFLKEYDFSFWVDAGFLIVGDVIKYVNRYTQKDFLAVAHSVRNCLYDEAKEVLRLEMENNDLLLKQTKRYRKNNYPKNNGLIESGLLFRRHNNPKIIKVMKDWFSEVINYSKRDQISFNYVAWKNNLDFDIAKMYCTRNPYFHHYFHRVETVNNKVTSNRLRVMLINNNNFDELNKSIKQINAINDYIPISIITNDSNIKEKLGEDYYNLEIIYCEEPISSELVDTISSNKQEIFIHVMNAGELLNYDYILKHI